MTNRRDELTELTDQFVDAFNRQNLDDVVSFFAEDGVFEDGREDRHQGREAIAKAFAPLVAGGQGRIRFDPEDLFIETETGKVMVSWTLNTHLDSSPVTRRGMDILQFQGDKLVYKSAYTKVS